jgi:hypothetical protein
MFRVPIDEMDKWSGALNGFWRQFEILAEYQNLILRGRNLCVEWTVAASKKCLSGVNGADQKKASVPEMKLILESKHEQSHPLCLLKTVASDESNPLNHHAQSVDAHKHGIFQP